MSKKGSYSMLRVGGSRTLEDREASFSGNYNMGIVFK